MIRRSCHEGLRLTENEGSGLSENQTAVFDFVNGNYNRINPEIDKIDTTHTGVCLVEKKEGEFALIDENKPLYMMDGLQCVDATTNLIPYSENIENAAWGKNSNTVVTDNVKSFGDLKMSRLAGFNLGSADRIYEVLSITENKTYTGYFYVAAETESDVGKKVQLNLRISGSVNVFSDILTLTYTPQKLKAVITVGAGDTSVVMTLRNSNIPEVERPLAPLVGGVMLYQGKHEAPIIPTSGTAAIMNRTSYLLETDGMFGESEGGLVVDFKAPSYENGDLTIRVLSFYDNSSNYVILQRIGSGDFMLSYRHDGATTSHTIVGELLHGGYNRVILTWEGNKLFIKINENELHEKITSNAVNVKIPWRVYLGSHSGGFNNINSTIQALQFFNKKEAVK